MINRKELVRRHNPNLHEFNALSPLTVGNGNFAFNCDLTGLQTFPEVYEPGMPLLTQSNWGWHSYTTPDHLIGQRIKLAEIDTFGRKVGYHTSKAGQEELFEWLRINPHRFHLGQIGLEIILSDGSLAQSDDLEQINQELDLWRGVITSKFAVEGEVIEVLTAAHPDQDAVLVSVKSSLLAANRLKVRFAFPYGSHKMNGADWEQPEQHKTIITKRDNNSVQWVRIQDNDHYYCTVQFSTAHQVEQNKKHEFLVSPSGKGDALEFACLFSPEAPLGIELDFARGIEATIEKKAEFWLSGGAIELAESKDSRALELERRIILSQYNMAIQSGGNIPPQETGLTTNSWFGKAHLEMHWWHGVHFCLWGRPELLENSMWWYNAIVNKAEKHASEQGFPGARWPKMVGPDGVDSPSNVGPLLAWQQPHPIIYAELLYQHSQDQDTLARYQDIVFKTADFMAAFAHYDADTDRYSLGSMIPAQENHKASVTLNPTYEVEYWFHALKIAQQWRQRLGLEPNADWQAVIDKMAKPTVKDGVYLAHERCPDTFTEFNIDHPSMLCACGVLPGERIDKDVMRATLLKVLDCWTWERAWGWDFPVVAMTAARVGEPELAVDAFFIDSIKNTWLPNGHNYQRPNLPLYLPGNGGLLSAVAMMAAGWDGAPDVHAPGFPQDGSWTVKFEGLYPLL